MTQPARSAYQSPHWSILLVLYLTVAAAAPVLAWLSGYPRRPWNDELSSAAAMVAFAMLLMEFATTGRIRFITDRLQHDLTMHWHRITGTDRDPGYSFLHPIFLYAAGQFASGRRSDSIAASRPDRHFAANRNIRAGAADGARCPRCVPGQPELSIRDMAGRACRSARSSWFHCC